MVEKYLWMNKGFKMYENEEEIKIAEEKWQYRLEKKKRSLPTTKRQSTFASSMELKGCNNIRVSFDELSRI